MNLLALVTRIDTLLTNIGLVDADTTTILVDTAAIIASQTSDLAALTALLDEVLEERNVEPKVIPALAAGATVTAAAAGAYAKGAYVELVAAAGITTTYKPIGLVIDNMSAADEFEIELARGAPAAEIVIGTFKFGADGRLAIPSLRRLDANMRLAARVGCFDAVARTVNISVEYIDGLT